jgi:hypothetical protein
MLSAKTGGLLEVARDRLYIQQDHPIVERRRLQRTKIRHPGKILGQQEAFHDCVVHNITGLGVCIELGLQAEQLSQHLDFSFDNFHTIHTCSIIWREENLAGIAFEIPSVSPQSFDGRRGARFKLTKSPKKGLRTSSK